ncbi:MAG: 30S ribosome-binding factor RbfA [Deltaproteobacteria bacterium]|nr:30S ribosome-binding factor RbfA [Deltaproteobacteria bacterium]
MVAQGENRRLARVCGAIREELAHLLVKDVNDPLLAWVTLTSVEVSPDLRQARVYFAATRSNDPTSIERSLKKAAPFLQRELGSRLRLRYTPKLVFHYDSSLDQGERVDQLIREISKEELEQQDGETEAKKLDRLINRADQILVAAHRNPDGDAIGSLLGLSGILRLMGKDCTAYCPDGIPKILSFLSGADQVTSELDPKNPFNLTLLLDTADESLLPKGFPKAEKRGTLVVIDHHGQHGDIGDFVIRREASAVGEILFDISQELAWPINAEIAECLYTSIVADTGSFRYSSTAPTTHEAAARLLAAGARPWIVASQLYESFSLRRQQLLAEVLGTLEVSENGQFAYMFSTPEMLTKVGANKEDLDGMINFGRSIIGVEVTAMLRVEASGDIKVSFRSRGRIDVADLAARFDGGGHRNASGCTLRRTDLAKARQTIREAAKAHLKEAEANGLTEPLS